MISSSSVPPDILRDRAAADSRRPLMRTEFGEAAAVNSPGLRRDAADLVLRAAIVLGLAGVLWVTFATDAFTPLLRAAEARHWTMLVKNPSVLWAAMGSALLCVRTALWFRYRPAPPTTMAEAPFVSVVIPAYNEGPMVAKAIDSVAGARYPRDRLEIFAVDDGSRDDTWHHIQRAAARHPGLVTALKLPWNVGKRKALAAGFRRASGEVLVTIDSDSVIQPDALLALAGPFREGRVGAVAGKVTVLNRDQGLISRMLAVRFILSFDFLRAVQSTYGTVYCCPGALSGYRASAVRALLERWLGETFLGAPCTFGEDRAMTNLLLEAGFDTVYQSTAVVRTVVPWTYAKLCRMYLRWDRSYIREEIRYARIVWRRPPRALFLSLFETTLSNLRYPVYYSSLFLLMMLLPGHPLVLARLLVVVGLFSLFNMLYYLRSERSGDFLYGVLYPYFALFALFWIFPYAALTVRAQGWLTR
jgi:hyaluronan synthase